MIYPSFRLLPLGVVLLVALLGGLPLAAQTEYRQKLAYVLDDDDAITARVRKVEEAIAKKKFAEAVPVLLEIPLVAQDQVHALGEELHTGVRLWAIEQLSRLPASFVKLARKQRALEAQSLLERGQRTTAHRGEETLWRCVNRYPLTTGAATALERLADRALERGDVGLASRCLRRYLDTYRPALFDDLPWPRVLAKAAAAAARAADRRALERARTVLKSIAGHENLTIDVGDRDRPLLAYVTSLEIGTPWRDAVTRWPTLGGAPRRWRTPPLDPGTLAFRWIVTDPNIGNFDAGDEPRPADRRFSCLQPVYPVIDRGLAHYFNGRVLRSIELASGRTKAKTKFRDSNPADKGYQPYQFRHLSVGPRGLYTISEVDPENTNRVTQRCLRAFRLVDGRYRHQQRWIRGGPKDPHPLLSQARLTGNPLVIGDRVFVGGTVRGTDDRVYLFAFDAEDGRLVWSRFLCAGAGKRGDAKFQRVIGPDTSTDPIEGEVMVAEHAGALYVSTNTGVIAALARGDGEILWLNRYARRWRPANPSEWPTVTPSPWLDNSLLVTPDYVLATPRDSDLLHVLHLEPDRARGLAEAGVVPKTGIDSEFLYLIGADRGRVLLTERRWVSDDGQVFRIVALGLERERFESLWRFELPHVHLKKGEFGEFPAGRAQITAGRLLVPTTKHVHVLDLSSGELVTSLDRSPEMKKKLGWPDDYETPPPRGFGNIIPTPGGGFLSALPSSLTWWATPK